MSIRAISGIIILVTVVFWIGWDVYAFLTEENSTFSVIITDWSRQAPGIAFLCGMLCGHWFFPAKGSADK